MDRSAYDSFLYLETRHFWRIGKRRLVLEWMERYAPKPAAGSTGLRILDIGGACSLIPRELHRFGTVLVLESDRAAVELAREKLGVDIREATFPEQAPAGERFDVITMLDVLEHIREDDLGLKAARLLLKDDGMLLITVPAMMWLWSDHDVVLHHCRRYSGRELRAKLEGAGLRVERVTYYTGLLLPFLALQRTAGRLRSALTGRHKTGYDVKPPPGPLNSVFGATMSLERRLLRSVNLIAGSSLIAVARRSDAAPTPPKG